MGGRGSKSATSNHSGSIPVMSEQEYLDSLGLGSPVTDFMLDKMRLPHGETFRQRVARENAAQTARREYELKREAARAEYQAMVDQGLIREPNSIERLLKQARGHSDHESTQSARRALEKRGYDWKTGKDIVPDGMSRETYRQYVEQGFSRSEIRKIWTDTTQRRERMANGGTRGRSEHEVTSETYLRAAARTQRNVDSWFGRR